MECKTSKTETSLVLQLAKVYNIMEVGLNSAETFLFHGTKEQRPSMQTWGQLAQTKMPEKYSWTLVLYWRI